MSKRIYLVETNGTAQLINASSKQQAINHVAKGMITANVANQQQLVQLLTAGHKVVEAVDPVAE